MTLFEREVENSLSLIDYTYSDGHYLINREELLSLIESVSLGVIYNPKLRDEIYKENN